jgi:hypothetical protein
MTAFEATPQYEPAYRQSRFFSGDSHMRVQNMVWVLMKSNSSAKQRQSAKISRFGASNSVPCHQLKSRREHHHRSNPRRKTSNLHSLE